MRILHVITSLRTGGAEKLILDLVPLLKKRGAQVDVLLFDEVDTPFLKALKEEGILVYSLPFGKYIYNPFHILSLIPYLFRYDIIHTHNTACQYFVAIAYYIFFPKVKLVTTEHNTTNRRRNIFFFRIIDKFIYHQYHTIISVSNKTTENLRKYVKGIRKIHTVFNGINLSDFQDISPVKRDMGLKIICMVAGFRKQKDQMTLIRALSELPSNYHLWLIGEGETKQACVQLTQDLNLLNRVSFLGERTDVPRFLKASDVIVMSSHYEGLSLSSIEGMAVNRPFIASDVDGLHEIVKGAGVLFKEGDNRELAEKIRELVDDDKYAAEIAKACLSVAIQYDIRKVADSYFSLYEETIK